MSKVEKLIELDILFKKVSLENQYHFKNMLPECITHSQFFLLSLIYNIKDCKAADITQILDISPAAASNMIERLYKNNWVERIRSEEDRRIVRLKLSEEGEKLLKEIEEKKIQMLLKVFKNISDDELDILINIFNKMLVARV